MNKQQVKLLQYVEDNGFKKETYYHDEWLTVQYCNAIMWVEFTTHLGSKEVEVTCGVVEVNASRSIPSNDLNLIIKLDLILSSLNLTP